MEWTTTPPTKPGWYWWRDKGNYYGPRPVEFVVAGDWTRIFLFGCEDSIAVQGEWGPEIVLPDFFDGKTLGQTVADGLEEYAESLKAKGGDRGQ